MDQRLITLMMEAACTSDTSVYSNVTTLRYIVGGSHRRTRRRENLKFHIKYSAEKGREVNYETKGRGRKRSWHNLGFFPGNCLKGLRKAT